MSSNESESWKSFRTYVECSPTVTAPSLTPAERNALLEEERAARYRDQAKTALRLAEECESRAKSWRSQTKETA